MKVFGKVKVSTVLVHLMLIILVVVTIRMVIVGKKKIVENMGAMS